MNKSKKYLVSKTDILSYTAYGKWRWIVRGDTHITGVNNVIVGGQIIEINPTKFRNCLDLIYSDLDECK